MERKSGILMPITSLPSRHGIGTLGRAAHHFVDFLVQANQHYWQILPIGPTSYGDSPYQSVSAFAGNPYLIDLDLLVEDGLLTQEAVERVDWGNDPVSVDYEALFRHRHALLYAAYQRGYERDREAVEAYAQSNAHWLGYYALFMALKRRFHMRAWTEWEDESIRLCAPQAVAHYTALLQDAIAFYTYEQFLFDRQWTRLKAYANKRRVHIIGDLPIYVPLDSVDVWSESDNFLLNEAHLPTAVAGVPPDYFSSNGQLWGNPLYDWSHLEQTGFRWWIRRVQAACAQFDVVRIDHFRGLDSYWAIPYGAPDARTGVWKVGPRMKLIRAMEDAVPNCHIIAEDLGYLTDSVRELLCDAGYPGMKVLQFAFDSSQQSDYLPHNYPRNCVVYTGTHDNTTLVDWFRQAPEADVAFAKAYLGLNAQEGYDWGFIRGGMSSVADLFIAQMQDYLGLDGAARMNIPGTCGHNWKWRVKEDQLTDALAERIARYTRMYGRS